MTLDYIYKEFQNLKSKKDKVLFLEELKGMNLPFWINWDNVIAAWSPKEKKNDE